MDKNREQVPLTLEAFQSGVTTGQLPRIKLAELEQQLKPFKTVRINQRLKTSKNFQRAFKSKGIAVGASMERVIKTELGTFAPDIRKVRFTVASLKQLTGKEEADYSELYSRFVEAISYPLEIWLNLRLQYLDQPHNECLFTLARYREFDADYDHSQECVLAIDNDPSVGKWIFARSIGHFSAPTIFPGDSLWVIPQVIETI